MQQRIITLLLSIFSSLILLILVWGQVAPAAGALFSSAPLAPLNPKDGKIDPQLLAHLAQSPPAQTHRFIIYLAQKADLTDLKNETDVLDRRTLIVARLQATAVASQADLVDELALRTASAEIKQYQPLWIINAVAAEGTAAAITAIAARNDVAEIRLDAVVQNIKPPEEQFLQAILETPMMVSQSPSWGIDRVRAPHVWHGLRVDGTGVTVGIMDGGVDFEHPDLIENYRGNLGNGVFEHSGNWYNTVSPTVNVPTDTFGHGTHVAGTAVGRNGIGVAPGAQWIAVDIAQDDGFILVSDTHEGFQWLLAPDNDPALAPDIINGSWSGPGSLTEFVDDVTTLQAAGIIPVFAAGNAGPFTQTVGYPSSYTNTLSIGASDEIDDIAWFSSLGPSPLTEEIKPWLVAPGTFIISAQPKGQYGAYNGTSMSAPHVSGGIALLLAANPNLGEAAVVQKLAETAVPLSSTRPNMVSGWGRMDVYNLLRTEVNTGKISGSIFSDSVPQPNLPFTLTTPAGVELPFTSDESGQFEIDVKPGNYAFRLNYFGHQEYQSDNIQVHNNQTTNFNLNLVPYPTGGVSGIVFEESTQQKLAGALIDVLDTPLQTVSDENGFYRLDLPAGTYKLRVTADDHRLGATVVSVIVGNTITQHFWLMPGPKTLLIDSGQWYFQSQASYYQEALFALGYAHDVLTVRNPLRDAPQTQDLLGYDNVIWSAPRDSPGILGTGRTITNYLGQGGNLLISGKNVAFYDGFGFTTQLWWLRDLKGSFMGETVYSQTITGVPNSNFGDMSISLNGEASAGNQTGPDMSVPRLDTLTEPIFTYENGIGAGLQADLCNPYHILYFGFGLEGISDPVDRHQIIERSFDQFAEPDQPFGVRFAAAGLDDIAIPGTTMVYTLTIQNTSELLTDTIDIEWLDSGWNTSITTQTLTLGPCQSGQTILEVTVPAGEPKNSRHTTQIVATSQANPAVFDYLLVEHKTAGHLLFVDDDRWYDEEHHLLEALRANSITPDLWEIGWQSGKGRGSPSLALLNEYDFVFWYTGYDWYAPLQQSETANLADYLDQGGRLFLTSQDFLYYNADSTLATLYLGVLAYAESVTPTLVYGGNHSSLGGALSGPYALDPGVYQNNGDGLIPTADSQPFFWHNSGLPAGIANTGDTWRSLFWGISFEMLPDEKEVALMNAIIGWLGDLGDSSFSVSARTSQGMTSQSYTITLRNAAIAPENQVRLTNTLPAEMIVIPGSISGNAVYDPEANQLTWSGLLPSAAEHTIVYDAILPPDLVPGTAVTNHVLIHYDRHDIQFEQTAVVWVNSPDLSASTLMATPNQAQAATDVVYDVVLSNSGLTAATAVSTVVRLPLEMQVLTSTLATSSGRAWLNDHRINWIGDINPGQSLTMSIQLVRETPEKPLWLPATAVIQDGVTHVILKEDLYLLQPYSHYLPLIVQN